MASVFLSYDHDDAGRAAPLAAALEKAGHSVWWDRHIHVGAEYNSEIEGAVNRADAVIVLWSERSIRSAWVRDEAAEGRDQGKLVPVLLDKVKPPMGFRQFQTIDLTAQKRKGRSTAPADLLRAIELLSEPAAREVGTTKAMPSPVRRVSPMLLVGLAAVVIAALGLFWWRSSLPASAAPRIAVLANDDSLRSRSLAENLLVQLGSLQAAKADVLNLVAPESGGNADLVFKVGAVAALSEPRATLSLIANSSKTLLWSREFVQPGGNESDLRQQLAYSAAQVLRCAMEVLAQGQPKIELATLKLYLNGCADLSTTVADPRTTIPLLRKVTEQAPDFPGGWGKLIVAELEAFKRTAAADQMLQDQLRSDIDEARKVDPSLPEIYLAQSWLQPPRPILGWMRFAEEALAKNPDHPETLENHALGMLHVGRMGDAVADARRAAQVEPLSSSARQSLIYALMDAGMVDAARNELHEAERLWPGATNLLQVRYTLEFRYGDPEQAIRLLRSGGLGFTPPAAAQSFLDARRVPAKANVDRALADARSSYERTGDLGFFVHALATFGRVEELVDVLLETEPSLQPGVIIVFFRPPFAPLHRDVRFMAIAKRFGLIEYWQSSGKWPDFCLEPKMPYDCKREAAQLPV